MKPICILASLLIAVAVCAVPASPQTPATQPNDGSEHVTQLKLQIVLTEMEGTKKISSLPYTLRISASAHPTDTQLKLGARVPVRTGGKDNEPQFQYLDVGTNISSTAKPLDGGRYQLHLQIDRSTIYTSGTTDKPFTWSPTDPLPSTNPLMAQFREVCDLVIRDGQTLQAGTASDPVTGHVMTVDVTINVEK